MLETLKRVAEAIGGALDRPATLAVWGQACRLMRPGMSPAELGEWARIDELIRDSTEANFLFDVGAAIKVARLCASSARRTGDQLTAQINVDTVWKFIRGEDPVALAEPFLSAFVGGFLTYTAVFGCIRLASPELCKLMLRALQTGEGGPERPTS